ncbi:MULTISPECIES: phosphoribosylglycinamide formyltransferase [Leptospira]|uniref:Phosphoribosylglycinamide formyltransferase n=6 Tax=Leptospira borgpetersenii TaxID=174 RepID=A0A0E3B156_LEPBO|nr:MULTISPECIES: phosphoribosylglycinamide formyltransferase [Leptospira]EMO10521.1 phosphoribosylglycinamide formyltransferase [Leptospira borgpetersenii str. Noumea 25]ABJ75915.1 Phosphoribosylglycinamide formyltransferase [Leptospira borgpetersenii serovar Hardjo-bovis str. JB197]ABJ79018.1 Phosphoribosylglycinamide formyltransferase [Leptospira borgpetersenii serovar Hardjo-bovis str. L550]ALO25689.1 phosphoribosylglycinamide formyltransferase [Leptospira borgpetersenii serovar Ballum]AMX5
MASPFTKPKKKIVFLTSGRGSNLKAVLQRIKVGKIRGVGSALICDNPDAKALEVAQEFKLPSHVFNFASFVDKSEYHKKLLNFLIELEPDLIVTAGYMKILKNQVIQAFPNRIINIHPSLLPAFPGLNAQKQAFEYGVKIAGCTAHFVDEGVDSGPVILQGVVKIEEGMSERDLTLEILKEEHKILPLAVQYFCEDRLKIHNRKVSIE